MNSAQKAEVGLLVWAVETEKARERQLATQLDGRDKEGIKVDVPYEAKEFSCRLEMIEYAARDNELRRQMNLWHTCVLIEALEPYAKEIMRLRMKVAGSKGGKKAKGKSGRKPDFLNIDKL